jgi:anti-sigma factor RsiW
MKSGLEQFDSREAMLLMYLADELSVDDKHEVNRLLAEDETLRAELESLREMESACFSGLAEMDRVMRPPVPESVTIRRVSRLIRNWVKEQAEIPEPIPMPVRTTPWLRYGVAVAAMVMIGYFLWPTTHLTMKSTLQAHHYWPQDDATTDDGQAATEPAALSKDDELALLTASFGDNSASSDDSSNIRVAAITGSDSLDLPIANP